jgi:osmotically-inducible protein OsmY
MKIRRVMAMVAVCFADVLLMLPLTRVRAHARPQASEPSVAVPARPALPAMPALPAVPAIPVEPAAPTWEPAHAWGSTHWGDGPAADCSDLHIRLNDERPTIEAEERTVTKGEAPVLRVRELKNGGVQVQGWDKDAYSVTACKAAVGGDAARLLSEIKLAVQGGEVSMSGPHGDREDWTVYLLIRTPRSAGIEVTAHNGPVSFYTVDGKITTRATNGPISMKDCSGEANVSAENGPISFSGASGKLRLHTQNGPITVSLGSNWDGSELVADAVNGPLTLRVPSGFRSSFLVESNGHSPVSCHASICSDARKTWDDEHRRIEYGSGSPVIRLSTENGPISVAD